MSDKRECSKVLEAHLGEVYAALDRVRFDYHLAKVEGTKEVRAELKKLRVAILDAPRDRERKELCAGLRTTQCCDPVIDGRIGALIEENDKLRAENAKMAQQLDSLRQTSESLLARSIPASEGKFVFILCQMREIHNLRQEVRDLNKAATLRAAEVQAMESVVEAAVKFVASHLHNPHFHMMRELSAAVNDYIYFREERSCDQS